MAVVVLVVVEVNVAVGADGPLQFFFFSAEANPRPPEENSHYVGPSES